MCLLKASFIKITTTLVAVVTSSMCAWSQLPALMDVDLDPPFQVIQIEQDNSGALWLLGDRALQYFDGHHSELFKPDSSVSGQLSYLALQSDRVVVGTSTGQICFVDPRSGEFSVERPLASQSKINRIAALNDSSLFIAQQGTGIFEYQPGSASTQLECDEDFVHSIAISPSRVHFTGSQGVWNLDPESGKCQLLLKHNLCTYLEFEKDNDFWVCTHANTLLHVDSKGTLLESFDFSQEQSIQSLALSNSQLYVSTRNKILVKSLNHTTSSWSAQEDPISNGKLFVDDECNLWVFSEKSGVYKGVEFVRRNDWKNGQIQSIMCMDTSMFVGTDSGLFHTNLTGTKSNHVIQSESVTCLRAVDNHVLIGTLSNGLLSYDLVNRELTSLIPDAGEGLESILAFSQEQDKTILASTLGGVISISLENNQWLIEEPTSNQQLKQHYILAIHQSEGREYFATDKAGLIEFHNGSITKITHSIEGKKLGSIFSIAADGNGQLWASSSGCGLIYIKEGQAHEWIHPHGVAPTYQSIIHLEPDHLLLVGESVLDYYNYETNEMVTLDEEIQLIYDEPFLNNYCIHDGVVRFVHSNEIWSFVPPPPGTRSEPITKIRKMLANLEPTEFPATEFNRGQNNISFEISGTLHRNPDRVFYQFMLEGFDQEWRITRDNVIMYPQLSAGDYVFKVNATHDEFNAPLHPKTYSFRIKPGLFERWWFIGLLVLILASIIYLISHRRRRNLIMRNELGRLRTETALISLKSQLNPHFLFNSFNTLVGLIEESPSKGVEFTELLTDFYRGILEISEKKLIPISQELELVTIYFKLLKERFGDAISLEINGAPQNGLTPPLALQMLVENAVKHNSASLRVPLRISISTDTDEIIVKNNINVKNQPVSSTGIGLANINRRYELLSGQSISIFGSDTMFEVRLPVIQSSAETAL